MDSIFKKIILALFLVCLSVNGGTPEFTPLIEQLDKFPKLEEIKDPEIRRKILEKQQEFEKISQLSELDSIIALSIIVGGRSGNDVLQNDVQAYKFRVAREMLLKIPHPAEKLAAWLEEQRALRMRQTAEDQQGIRRHEKDADYRSSLVFSAISQIQTPESVAVLGKYLSDTRDEKESVLGGMAGGNFRDAAFAFNCMGIKNAPTRQRDFSSADDHIQKWQQWFAEVEAGTRGFSFYGSDEVYYLKERTDAAGRKHIEADSVAISASNQNASESKDSAPTTSTLSAWKTVALAISSLLLLLGAWLSLRKRHA